MHPPAQRIVSLLPGATEWVCKLGLEDRLVGVSHECDFPDLARELPSVTRSRIASGLSSAEIDAEVREHCETKTPLYELDEKRFVDLRPDLVLTQSLCNVCAVSERDVLTKTAGLSSPCQLLDLKAHTFRDIFSDARRIVEATGSLQHSLDQIALLEARIKEVKQRSKKLSRRPVVTLLEWMDPLFCAGHWTPELIELAGGDDPIGNSGEPSRTIDSNELVRANPDMLLIACCGMDQESGYTEAKRMEAMDFWTQLKCVEKEQVHVFDGSAWFNRPGPRLVDALEHVAKLISQWSH